MSELPFAPESWNDLEALLLACLERPDGERTAALEDLCARHPEHAAGLRQRFAMLSELGFVGQRQPRALLAGERFGEYRLLQRLGGGSMGVVWLAEQNSTQRQVALKVLRPELLDQPRAHERFRRELAAAAKLDHPGICPVYDAGSVDGMPFLAMRHVAGGSLADAIERTRRSGRTTSSVVLQDGADARAAGERERIGAAVAMVEQLARALHVAHQRGLVHRDVKPANVLLGEDGSPVLVDFGLARDELAADPALTSSTDRLGSPAYMAPEQIEPRGRRADARTDVHALGAVLFECLTLHAPYEAPGREALYQQILTADPPDARHWNAAVPPDLAVVIQKALEKEPDRRYATSLALAEDLRRVRMREPVRARPAGPWLRLRRWAQRNPLLAGAVAAAFVSLGAGLAVALVLLADVESTLAERQAGDVAALSTRALDHDATLATHYALHAHRLEENPTTVSAVYAAAAELREERVFVGVESPYCLAGAPDGSWFAFASDQTAQTWVVRDGRDPLELETKAAGHALVHRLAVSPDGSRILVLSVGMDGGPGGLATVWDPDRPEEPLLRLPHPGEVLTGCFTADSSVLTGCEDGVARLWSADGTCRELRGHTHPVYSCAASPDGQLLVTGGQDCTVRRWDAGTGRQLGEPIEHGGWVVAIDFAPASAARSDRFVTATGYDSQRCWRGDPGFADDRGRVFDRDGRLVAELGRHRSRIERAVYSPDGQHVLTAGADQVAQLWRVDDAGVATSVAAHVHDNVIYGACFDPTGERVATVTFSGTVYLWERTGSPAAVLRGHRVCGTGCWFGRFARGERLVTTALDGTVRTWSIDSPFVRRWPCDRLCAATTANDDRWLVVAEQDGTVRVWERGEPRRLVVPPIATAIHNVACVACRGERIVLGDGAGNVHVFGLDGRRILAAQRHGGRIGQVAFHPVDADLVLSGSSDGTARLWDLRRPDAPLRAGFAAMPMPAGAPVSFVSGTSDYPLWNACFSPGGRWIATVTDDPGCVIKLWPVDTVLEGGAEGIVMGRHDHVVRSMAFAANGEHVACATLQGAVWLWHVPTRTGSRLRQLERDVTAIAVSPDASTIACGLMDGTVHVLGRDGLRFTLPQPMQPGRVKSLHFVDDGSRLLVAARPGRVTEWPLHPGDLVQQIEARGLARPLTDDERRDLARLLAR